MQRHRHIEWLKFLRQIEREAPKDKTLHLIADNYAIHKRPLFVIHLTPTSVSWLNMVECLFRDITVNRLRRGVFTSVPELTGTIDACIAQHNLHPKPFIWTKTARDIL